MGLLFCWLVLLFSVLLCVVRLPVLMVLSVGGSVFFSILVRVVILGDGHERLCECFGDLVENAVADCPVFGL